MIDPQHWLSVREVDDWRNHAACLTADLAAFFPITTTAAGESAEPAVRICRGCPVRMECLDFALTNDERYGVWGGATERDRAQMKGRKRP